MNELTELAQHLRAAAECAERMAQPKIEPKPAEPDPPAGFEWERDEQGERIGECCKKDQWYIDSYGNVFQADRDHESGCLGCPAFRLRKLPDSAPEPTIESEYDKPFEQLTLRDDLEWDTDADGKPLFVAPKKGQQFLNYFGNAETATLDWPGDYPRLILRKRQPRRWVFEEERDQRYANYGQYYLDSNGLPVRCYRLTGTSEPVTILRLVEQPEQPK